MSYSGKLIESLVRRRTGNIVSRSVALNAKSAIDTKYGHVDEGTEYRNVPFSSAWKKDSDFAKSVKKSATLKSPHSLVSKPKPVPMRQSPQKLLTEGRKSAPKRVSPERPTIALPAKFKKHVKVTEAPTRSSPQPQTHKIPTKGKKSEPAKRVSPLTQRISPSKIERRHEQLYKVGSVYKVDMPVTIKTDRGDTWFIRYLSYKIATYDAHTGKYTIQLTATDKRISDYDSKTGQFSVYTERDTEKSEKQRSAVEIKELFERISKMAKDHYKMCIENFEYKEAQEKEQAEKEKRQKTAAKAAATRKANEEEMETVVELIKDGARPIRKGTLVATTSTGYKMVTKEDALVKGSHVYRTDEKEFKFATNYIKKHKLNTEYTPPTRASLDKVDEEVAKRKATKSPEQKRKSPLAQRISPSKIEKLFKKHEGERNAAEWDAILAQEARSKALDFPTKRVSPLAQRISPSKIEKRFKKPEPKRVSPKKEEQYPVGYTWYVKVAGDIQGWRIAKYLKSKSGDVLVQLDGKYAGQNFWTLADKKSRTYTLKQIKGSIDKAITT